GGSDGGIGGDSGAGGAGGPAGGAGAPGGGGNQGFAGAPGEPGGGAISVTTNVGGAIALSEGCKLWMANCTLNSNRVENESGGAIYYARECTTQLERCSVGSNTAGLYGGALAFEVLCQAKIIGCTFGSNTAAFDGGGIYSWYENLLDVNDTTFSDNRATGPLSSGGAVYAGGTWDDKVKEWYNGSTIRLKKSQFTNNSAAFGGALYWYGEGADIRVDDCVIRGNTAQDGGGLYWSGGAAALVNCSIRGNTALGPQYPVLVPAPIPIPTDPNTWPVDPNTWPDPNDPNSLWDPNNPFTPPPVQQMANTDFGVGGGLVCWTSEASIDDCFISENRVNGSGGGIYFGGDPGTPCLSNCLIKDNAALIGGGGIASYWYAAPKIVNCTLVGNSASDPNTGYGGGLFCSYESQTVLLDSILWGNTAPRGTQIALGSRGDPIFLPRGAMLTVRFSDVQHGRTGVHVEQGAVLDWLAGNIDEDPLFVGGHFLSQTAAGQPVTSPAVDAGNDRADRVGLSSYTTRTDGVGDTGKVDMGFHYPPVGRYRLTVSVIGGGGTVTPLVGTYHEFQEVELSATPEPGYRVKRWIGTMSDPSWNQNMAAVLMDADNKFVTVEFEPAATRNLLVPAQYRTIEEAVLAASHGDTNIIINEGVHYVTNPAGIDLQGRNIRIMSKNPEDPAVVAKTIVDARGSRFIRRRAFRFGSGETNECIIAGLTIRNGYWIGDVGVTGGILGGPVDPTDAQSPFRADSGTDANGIGYGGAILCENASSPTFKNCVIEDSLVVGAQGGDGVSGPAIPAGSNADGVWGGHGGTGTGNGFGGAIACLGASKPQFFNCTIRNCTARGGLGGHGGNGSNPNAGGGRESWGGNAGGGIGFGRAGAVYCEAGSDATFERCLFTNNRALNGAAGQVGRNGPGNGLSAPYPNPAAPGAPGLTAANGLVAGGAVYQNNANPKFFDCRFAQNEAYEVYLAGNAEGRVYTLGGALYSDVGNEVILKKCRFDENANGAVFVATGSILDLLDCVFSKNRVVNSLASIAALDPNLIDPNSLDPNNVTIPDVSGALYVSPGCPDVRLRRCSFQGNVTLGNGGAVRLLSDADIIQCDFSGNRAGENGGAIHAYYRNDPNVPVVLGVNLEACTFGGNQATEGLYGQGGALYFEDVNAVLTDCHLVGNKAKSGGGLFQVSGTLKLRGGSVGNNVAIGGGGVPTGLAQAPNLAVSPPKRGDFKRDDAGAGIDGGGGLVLAGANAKIEDCAFFGNAAQGPKGSGGAISFYGGYVGHTVRNCLFVENSAQRDGGAIWAGLFASPLVKNSTFSKNVAPRLGGAIFCDWSASVTVRDSIFDGNEKYAIAEEDFVDSDIRYSLFFGNTPADYALFDSVAQKAVEKTGLALSPTNLTGDPKFVPGPLGDYYLSQKAAGQDVTSPAVDAGSTSAANAGLAELTTRTDGVPDMGQVDLGYHFPDHTKLPKYKLTAEVIGGHGGISPTSGEFYAGTVVTIKAEPESGWRIAEWAGTTNNASTKKTNTVVMHSDRHVTVRFEQPRTLVVGSASRYATIQSAIDAAKNGDVVLVPTGVYEPVATADYPYRYLRIIGKNITLTGANPDDPNVVANTILRRFQFEISDVGPEMVIDGLTMGNVNWVGFDGGAGTQSDGSQGTSMTGGVMNLYWASPTIRNCRFVDCSITGGNGGAGDNGTDTVHPNGYNGGWAGWAYGGAVYIAYGSNPLFENCLFQNCRVYGGNGGAGGNGATGGYGGRGGNWMLSEAHEQDVRVWWDGWELGPFDADGNLRGSVASKTSDPRGYFDDYWKYSGYGGAVYIEFYSCPKFVDCNFSDNRAYGGVSGLGGTGTNVEPLPNRAMSIGSFGGAVYIGQASDPEFIGCVFKNNAALDANTVANPPSIYTTYGGAIAIENDSAPVFIRCVIEDSNAVLGGGLYWSQAAPKIVDCNIVSNVAFQGGGAYAVGATGTIVDTIIHRNRAYRWTVDPNFLTDPNAGATDIYGWGGGFAGINAPVEICHSIVTNNRASGSGGGVYFGGSEQDVKTAPSLHNCLITSNGAGRDGGGVSVHWFNEPMLSNCTIADNFVARAPGDAFGGGLSVAYESNAVLIN
ncbi:MAG: hypothetical protein FJ280_17840, partial [Planctomycetes bacterium]|nr:hypothetical protein [Planctomycetota bacterium]